MHARVFIVANVTFIVCQHGKIGKRGGWIIFEKDSNIKCMVKETDSFFFIGMGKKTDTPK